MIKDNGYTYLVNNKGVVRHYAINLVEKNREHNAKDGWKLATEQDLINADFEKRSIPRQDDIKPKTRNRPQKREVKQPIVKPVVKPVIIKDVVKEEKPSEKPNETNKEEKTDSEK